MALTRSRRPCRHGRSSHRAEDLDLRRLLQILARSRRQLRIDFEPYHAASFAHAMSDERRVVPVPGSGVPDRVAIFQFQRLD